MAKNTKKNTTNSSKEFPWRSKKDKWENTMFEKQLLDNPSLMTNSELAIALVEINEYSRGKGKYAWNQDPIAEGKEAEMPFSLDVIGRFIDEASARLLIVHNLSAGRFK